MACNCGCTVTDKQRERDNYPRGSSMRQRITTPVHGHVTRREWIRFCHKFVVTSDGHWIWTAAHCRGYGKLAWRRQHWRAAAFAFSALRGDIPQGYEPDHLCRLRRCVNPACLELVTPRENTLRGTACSALNARATHCKHGHPFTPENTYRRRHKKASGISSPGRVCITCRKRRSRAQYQQRGHATVAEHLQIQAARKEQPCAGTSR